MLGVVVQLPEGPKAAPEVATEAWWGLSLALIYQEGGMLGAVVWVQSRPKPSPTQGPKASQGPNPALILLQGMLGVVVSTLQFFGFFCGARAAGSCSPALQGAAGHSGSCSFSGAVQRGAQAAPKTRGAPPLPLPHPPLPLLPLLLLQPLPWGCSGAILGLFRAFLGSVCGPLPFNPP